MERGRHKNLGGGERNHGLSDSREGVAKKIRQALMGDAHALLEFTILSRLC